MTVEELIEELQRHPKHVEVKVLVRVEDDQDIAGIERVQFCGASWSGKSMVQLEIGNL